MRRAGSGHVCSELCQGHGRHRTQPGDPAARGTAARPGPKQHPEQRGPNPRLCTAGASGGLNTGAEGEGCSENGG